jgi:outer membrane protein with beta-barrel domain
MRQTVVGIAMLAAVVLGTAAPARAQGFELAAGYAYLHVQDLPDALPVGWMVSASGRLASWLWLVGEINGNYKTYSAPGGDLRLSEHTFLAGPRISGPPSAPVSPFVQFLFGAAHGAADVGVPNVNLTISGTNFAAQIGGGIDINVTPGFGIRNGFDLRAINTGNDSGTGKQWRYTAALVFRP